jgi:putative membrane protein
MIESKQQNRTAAETDARTGVKIDANTIMAAERTFLAWIRTGLALMGFGFVVARFGLFLRILGASQEHAEAHSTGISLWVGTTLVLMGVAANVIAAWQHARLLQRLKRGEQYHAPQWSIAIIVAVVLGVLGVIMALNITLLH